MKLLQVYAGVLVVGTLLALEPVTSRLDQILAPAPRAEPFYAFRLPQLFLTCFRYKLRDGENFDSWNIEQPTVLDGVGTSNVRISHVRFAPAAICEGNATVGNAVLDVGSE